MNLLNNEGLFGRIFGFLGQLIALNLLWMICTLPVITAGASTTALYYCTLKMHKYGDCNVCKDFFGSLRQNIKQSTGIWLLLLLAAGGLYLERRAVRTMPEGLSTPFTVILIAMCIPFSIIVLYIFPTVAAFDNTAKRLISSAFYFAVKDIKYTLAAALIAVLPMYFTLVDGKLFPIYLFIWLLCGFSLTAYGISWFIWKVFKPFFGENGENKEMSGDTDQYVF